MRIKYREPYWVKFNWDLSNHHENQYVTEFNKNENSTFKDFQHNEKFILTTKIKITKDDKTDKTFMIFGKPGKNFGLSYNAENGVLGFEFWSKGEDEDTFHFGTFNFVDKELIEDGVIISIVKNNKIFTLYKDFKKVSSIEFKSDLIEDYKETALFFGCSNPGSPVEEHRYFGEVEIDYFSLINNISDIKIAKNLYNTNTSEILNKDYYDNIMCLYDFKSINNLGIVYDESKHTNFMEKVPNELIAN